MLMREQKGPGIWVFETNACKFKALPQFAIDLGRLLPFVILRRSEAKTGGPSGAEGDLFSNDIGRQCAWQVRARARRCVPRSAPRRRGLPEDDERREAVSDRTLTNHEESTCGMGARGLPLDNDAVRRLPVR